MQYKMLKFVWESVPRPNLAPVTDKCIFICRNKHEVTDRCTIINKHLLVTGGMCMASTRADKTVQSPSFGDDGPRQQPLQEKHSVV